MENPKFMAQPPLVLKKELDLSEKDNNLTPVESAIFKGIDMFKNRQEEK